MAFTQPSDKNRYLIIGTLVFLLFLSLSFAGAEGTAMDTGSISVAGWSSMAYIPPYTSTVFPSSPFLWTTSARPTISTDTLLYSNSLMMGASPSGMNSDLNGLFSNALVNYQLHPTTTPYTPSAAISSSLYSTSWDTWFPNPSLGCGCTLI
jgi:hypothetical protein